jgi:hypothetical protein
MSKFHVAMVALEKKKKEKRIAAMATTNQT